VARVLCLGGSTTYGWGVAHAAEAYPARLEAILGRELPSGVNGVEVINGGLPYGTSAEMLTHYLFKFHYFRPDLVILEAGGNDADALTRLWYQPDYSHWRQAPCVAPSLPPWTRWMMRSRLVSFGYILAVHGALHEGLGPLIRPGDGPPSARWYPEAGPVPPGERRVPPEDLALAHNLDVLVREAQADGARVLLVPFRPAPGNTYPALTQRAVATNEEVMRAYASDRDLVMTPFPAAVITAANWVDNCHLNAAGEGEKAEHIAGFARRLLWPER